MNPIQQEVERAKCILDQERKHSYFSSIPVGYVEGLHLSSQYGYPLITTEEGLTIRHHITWNDKQITVEGRLK